MSGLGGVRGGPGYGPLAGHGIWAAAPDVAKILEVALSEHITEGTRKGYESAVKTYSQFLADFGGPPPFPVDAVWLCAWIVYVCMDISVASVKVYLQGIKYGQGCHGSPWTLDGDERLRRTLRWVKREYGMASRAPKVPLSLRLLLKLFAHIPGWPALRQMSHNDRVYVAGSVVATLGFLRGGEFLWSKGSFRKLLLGRDLTEVSSSGSPAVKVSIPQPKTRWWLQSVAVLCFRPAIGCPLDPVGLVRGMRELSVVPMGPTDAAFPLADGSPLSRAFAVNRTVSLMTAAGVRLVDHRGEPLDVKAASWRAGGVASAKEANISDAVIMELGRWTSTAWLHYSVTDLQDVQKATYAMWKAARADGGLVPNHVVGVSAPADGSEVDAAAQARDLLSVRRV